MSGDHRHNNVLTRDLMVPLAMSRSTSAYSPPNHNEEPKASSEKLILQSPDCSDDGHPAGIVREQSWRHWLISLANGLVFGSALSILVYSAIAFPTDIQCGRQLSTYSPALDSLEYVDIRFNGTLTAPSIYRGDPSVEIDDAWFSFSRDPRPLRMSESTVLRAGKSIRSSTVRYKEEDGGGYKTSVEYTHQLHCLNFLRETVYRNHYESQGAHIFDAKPETVRTHMDHCVEMLRQVLMCNADTGIITYEWVDGFQNPRSDFNTLHRCRNFDKIQNWNLGHSAMVLASHMTRLANTVDRPEVP